MNLLLIGEAWGEHEEKLRLPFVGASGVELLKMLGEAGIISITDDDVHCFRRFFRTGNPEYIAEAWRLHDVGRTNVFNARPRYNKIENFCGTKAEGIKGFPPLAKSKYVRQEFIGELERLSNEIVEANPNLIVCLGNSALWALDGHTGIGKLRGTTRYSTTIALGYKLLPTYHPAAVLRDWSLRPIAVADLTKARREMEFPEIRRPHREIYIEPTEADIRTFYETHIVDCESLSVDIETSGSQVTCIGLSPRPDIALVVPFFDARRKGKSYWPDRETEVRVWNYLRGILEDRTIRKVFQNGLYDIAFLHRSIGVKVYGAEHDTMLLHHALQPEMLKSLGFLGSIYCDEGAWKTERKTATIKRDE